MPQRLSRPPLLSVVIVAAAKYAPKCSKPSAMLHHIAGAACRRALCWGHDDMLTPSDCRLSDPGSDLVLVAMDPAHFQMRSSFLLSSLSTSRCGAVRLFAVSSMRSCEQTILKFVC